MSATVTTTESLADQLAYAVERIEELEGQLADAHWDGYDEGHYDGFKEGTERVELLVTMIHDTKRGVRDWDEVLDVVDHLEDAGVD